MPADMEEYKHKRCQNMSDMEEYKRCQNRIYRWCFILILICQIVTCVLLGLLINTCEKYIIMCAVSNGSKGPPALRLIPCDQLMV